MPRPSKPAPAGLAAQLHAALPQTQCTRCGYPDCAAYAEALATGDAALNQCPPGGADGIARLAALTGRPILPLSPAHGTEGPRHVAVIDEAWCIGCTLCIDACPTDAIVGTHKRMHTVDEPHCTGCERCIPVCPVDCIRLENVTGERTGWAAWSAAEAATAQARYERRQARLARDEVEHRQQLEAKAAAKLADLPAHSQLTEPAALDRKRALIEAALAKARAAREHKT